MFLKEIRTYIIINGYGTMPQVGFKPVGPKATLCLNLR